MHATKQFALRVALDVLLLSGACVLSYGLRIGSHGVVRHLPLIVQTLPLMVGAALFFNLH